MAPIRGIRAGSRPTKRHKSATYTQAQVDLIVHDQIQSYHLVAQELRQLILDLSRTRQPSRLADYVTVEKQALLWVLSKSADLADF